MLYPQYLPWKIYEASTRKIQPPFCAGSVSTTNITQNPAVPPRSNCGRGDTRCQPIHMCKHIFTAAYLSVCLICLRSKGPQGSSRFQPYHAYQDHIGHRAWSPSEKSDIRHAREHFVPSDATHECDSNSDPSPTTPATPESILSAKGARSTFSESQKSPRITSQRAFFPRHAGHADHSTTWSSVRRNSCEVDSDSNPTRPHRPW